MRLPEILQVNTPLPRETGPVSESSVTPRPARVALVRPPGFHILANLSYFGPMPPLGLAYVSAVVREAGHRLTVIDAAGDAPDRVVPVEGCPSLHRVGLTTDEIVARIPEDTEIVGISHMFLHEWPAVRELARRVKEALPDVAVVLGGENATAFWQDILSESIDVDYCVIGEGEATFLELIARLKSGAPTADIPGLARRGTATLSARPRIPDLGAIPLPAWDCFPLEKYLRARDTFGVHRGRSLPILATRGCPYQCTYCSAPGMWRSGLVYRPPGQVVDEIRTHVQRYRLDNVNFCDLTGFVKRDWILEFCRLLKAAGLGITWQLPVGTRSEILDEEVLRSLYEAGCRNITMSPESGSERLLKILRKGLRLDRFMTTLGTALKTGLVTRLAIVLGHPEERRVDVWRTARLLFRAAWMGCHDISVMMFAPYPGSEDYERLRANGLVSRPVDPYEALARSGRSVRTYNPVMGRRELVVVQWVLLVGFYAMAFLRRPFRIVRLVWSLVTGAEESHVEQLLRTKLRLLRLRRGRRPAGGGPSGDEGDTRARREA